MRLVITGTSRGIGRGLAERYLARGFQVAGCSRSVCDLTHERYRHDTVDLLDEDGIRQWIRSVARDLGGIDGLVASAGVAPAGLRAAMTSGAVVDSVLRTNVSGTFLVCREVSKIMMRQRKGR